MLQGQRDIQEVSRLIMSELTPLVGGQHGAFFLIETPEEAEPELRLVSSYALPQAQERPDQVPDRREPRRPGGAGAEVDPDHAGARGLHHDLVRASARRRR